VNVAEVVQTRRWTAGNGTLRLWAILKAVAPTTLIFLIVGPPIGYFAVMLPIALTAIDGPFGIVQGLTAAFVFLPVGGVVAYMLGFMPAAVTGLAVALVDLVTDLGSYRTPLATALGASITVALLYGSAGVDLGSDSGGPAWALAAAVGAIAAGVCAMIGPRRAAEYRSLDGLGE
jgi:hypothetical protein